MKQEIKQKIDQIYLGETPDGYNQTDVGIIPTEWEVKRCSEIGEYKKGKGISTDDTVEIGLPAMMYGDIYVKYDTYFNSVDYRITEETAKYSTEVHNGDLLFTCSGETAEEIGKCVSYQGNETIFIGGDIVAISPNSKSNSLYLAYLQNSYPIIKQKAHLGQGYSVVHIYIEHIKTLKLPLPSLHEQEEIAEILRTWDKVIELKGKYISSLESRIKGISTKLLSPKEGWESVELGEVTDHYGGTALEDLVNKDGKYKFISIGNYSTDGRFIDKLCRIDAIGKAVTKILEKNDLVMVLNDKTPTGDIIGSTILIDEDDKYIYNQRSERIVCKNSVFYKYLWYVLNSKFFRKNIYDISQGGTQIYVNFSSIEKLNFYLPPLSEQLAIANILSLADREIELQKLEFEKLKLQKRSLMQLLLTGIVRVS